jgi:hypothetical protein
VFPATASAVSLAKMVTLDELDELAALLWDLSPAP